MRTFVVTIYDGAENRIGQHSGAFGSIDEAVRVLAMPDLIKVGAAADLRAIAWEEGQTIGTTAPVEHSYYLPRFVGADSE